MTTNLARVPFESIAFDVAKMQLSATPGKSDERTFSAELMHRLWAKLQRYVPANDRGDLVSFEAAVAIEHAGRELARHRDAGRFALSAAALMSLGAGTLASHHDQSATKGHVVHA